VRALVADPGPGLVADLAATELGEDEVVATVVLLLNAGHEASVNVLGNGMAGVLERGREVPTGAAAVEELLRHDSALQLFERTAREPVALGGVSVEAGERVAVLIGAANRDPTVFAGPDRLDVRRDPNPHLAFGAGVHFCLGAPLARMELVEALSALRAAYPTMELAEEPVRRGTFVLRGLRSLVVKGAS
jgi:cytochrome P450